MRHSARTGILVFLVLVATAGAFYWQRGRGQHAALLPAAPRVESPVSPVAAPEATPAGAGEENNAEHTEGDAGKTRVPPKKDAVKPDASPSSPLHAGEVLEYTADVAKISNVASLRLLTGERRAFQGKDAWHLQAFAHTQRPLRMVFELDDQFDSYSDASTLSSLQYELHLSERGQKVDSVQRMTTSGKEPAPANGSEAVVLPGTRDPLGMMGFLRNVDWTKKHEVSSPVYDGHKLYETRAVLAGTGESVEVPAGKYTASKIDIQVFDNGEELKDAHFSLYLANNDAHTPVLLEAVMPFATARVQLLSVK
jgi:Protein of unknown function (DUF3108)